MTTVQYFNRVEEQINLTMLVCLASSVIYNKLNSMSFLVWDVYKYILVKVKWLPTFMNVLLLEDKMF